MAATADPVEVALPASAQLGEGPTWDPAGRCVIWVDILSCEVHRFDPDAGTDTVQRTGQHVGSAKPRAGGGLVLNLRDGVGLFDSDGSFRWLAAMEQEGCRGNDAAVDASGRLWAGTMSYDETPGAGRLYRVEPGGEVLTVVDAVTISNGIGWSPDGRLMYYVDTPTRRIDVFDVDPDTGLVSGRQPFVEIDAAGLPDGLTVDADGCVWVALWDGGAVRRYTPDGSLDRVVTVPVSRPTACAFGGDALRDLYVTTARVGLGDKALTEQPHAGSLLVVTEAGVGLPGHAFAG